MKKSILTIIALGMLSACSGTHKHDVYVGADGKATVIESDREMCQRSCNEDYSRCMESGAAENNSGIKGPSGVFGASGDCRKQLKNCLPTCKSAP